MVKLLDIHDYMESHYTIMISVTWKIINIFFLTIFWGSYYSIVQSMLPSWKMGRLHLFFFFECNILRIILSQCIVVSVIKELLAIDLVIYNKKLM